MTLIFVRVSPSARAVIFTDMESCEVAGRDGVRLSYDGQLDESSDVSQGDAVAFDAGDMSCAVMTYQTHGSVALRWFYAGAV